MSEQHEHRWMVNSIGCAVCRDCPVHYYEWSQAEIKRLETEIEVMRHGA